MGLVGRLIGVELIHNFDRSEILEGREDVGQDVNIRKVLHFCVFIEGVVQGGRVVEKLFFWLLKK